MGKCAGAGEPTRRNSIVGTTVSMVRAYGQVVSVIYAREAQVGIVEGSRAAGGSGRAVDVGDDTREGVRSLVCAFGGDATRVCGGIVGPAVGYDDTRAVFL